MREEWLLCRVRKWDSSRRILLSDFVLFNRISGKPLDINIIQIYAPPSTRSDDDIEVL